MGSTRVWPEGGHTDKFLTEGKGRAESLLELTYVSLMSVFCIMRRVIHLTDSEVGLVGLRVQETCSQEQPSVLETFSDDVSVFSLNYSWFTMLC